MNLVLFSPEELGAPLPRRDRRVEHLRKVLHKKPGDCFDAGVLGGAVGRGRIEAVGEAGELYCAFEGRSPPPPKIPLRLGVGFPRPIQLRRLLRELAGFGVACIDVIAADLGDKSYRATTLLEDGGARAALIEGLEQARDTVLPEVCRFESLNAWIAAAGAERHSGLLCAACDTVDPRGSFASLAPRYAAAAVAVGPERGWSARERALFDGAGFLRLSLGSRALRTETACIAACVLAGCR
ncbi:MAG: RsmE family RNA methyltransferase [Spirochaetaceae bacterium]|jgi:RsmE family RNA methyltransferase|nr:RsmE family RNA methyltransferase [Spirochaetaceae bacterium]